MPGVGGNIDFMDGMIMSSKFQPSSLLQQHQHQQQYKSSGRSSDDDDDDEVDDAATCSAATTAAIAPRHRHRHHHTYTTSLKRGDVQQQQKRRAIGFTMDTITDINEDNNSGELAALKEVDVPSSLLTTNAVAGAKFEGPDQFKDPLLVAAQHAAGGEYAESQISQEDAIGIDAGGGDRTAAILLNANDCCSSVTEEETSLAEDEASLSAISCGANTIVSALSGGGPGSIVDGNSSTVGIARNNSLRSGSFDSPSQHKMAMISQQQQQQQQLVQHNNSQQSNGDVSMMNSNAATAQHQPPLNHILGGLHKERLTRLSMNRPLSRGDSSLHSLGSIGDGHSAASYRSLPGNIHHGSNAFSWNMPNNMNMNMNTASNQFQQHHPPSFVQQQQHPPHQQQRQQRQTPLSMMDEDAEMEEADTSKMALSARMSTSAIASGGGGGGSIASGSSFDKLSQASSTNAVAGSDDGDAKVPKWKRCVNLATHSNLY